MSGHRLLVMEWIDALGPASDAAALRKANLKPSDIMRTATQAGGCYHRSGAMQPESNEYQWPVQPWVVHGITESPSERPNKSGLWASDLQHWACSLWSPSWQPAGAGESTRITTEAGQSYSWGMKTGQRCLKTRSGTNADMLKNVQISSDISMRLEKLVGQVAVGALGSWPLLRIESKTASHACSDGKQIKTNGVIISSSSWISVSRHDGMCLTNSQDSDDN